MADDDRSYVPEIVIFIIGLLFSILAHCVAWVIYYTVTKIHERLKDCDDNIKSAGYLLEYSAITASVLQLSAEQLRFDPDVNEFERDVAILMLKDPQLTYTGETMHRQIKTKTKEDSKGPANDRPKTPLNVPKSEPEKEKPVEEEPKPKPPKSKKAGEKTKKDAPAEEENQGKKKFKPPPNITKADAKDPQYETLRGIGNELFRGEGAEKVEEEPKEEVKEESTAKIAFKPPEKVQKADAKDPQYETLADVKDDIFKNATQ